jgi:hypothetical protein
MSIGITIECIKCENKNILPTKVLTQWQVILCPHCDNFSIVVDSFLAHPDRINTSGIVKYAAYPRFVIEELRSKGIIKVREGVEMVTNIQAREIIRGKYDMDEKKRMINPA